MKSILRLAVTCAILLQSQVVNAQIPDEDFIEDKLFTKTTYYLVLEAFWEGMGWPTLYENADGCRLAVSDFFDDFYKLNVNHTQSTTQIEKIFNVTAIISSSYATTMYECYNLERQIQELFVQQENSFVDDNDKYTSFLFNLLAESIQIREYSYDLIDYSEVQDYVQYTQSLAGIISSIIYFDSSTAAGLKPDEFSPYYEDKYGNLHRRKDVEVFIQTYNQTFYRELFNKVDETIKMPLINESTPIVTQDEEPQEEGYKITIFTFVQAYFGFLNGALNALPVGGNLYYCGKDLESQRLKLVSMYEYYIERKLTSAVTDGYAALVYVNSISVYCYYGGLEYFTWQSIVNLYTDFDFLQNILFNAGFIWTDIVMLLVGVPGKTETDYAFYLFFYIGDFIFRFIFRSATADEGNCWYPWIECASETTLALEAAAA